MNQINIEIAYALPDRYYLKSFKVDEGTMIQTAILQSGILQQFTEIDLRENKVGIYSRPAKLTDQLKDGCNAIAALSSSRIFPQHNNVGILT